jgi:hypothetical protein
VHKTIILEFAMKDVQGFGLFPTGFVGNPNEYHNSFILLLRFTRGCKLLGF